MRSRKINRQFFARSFSARAQTERTFLAPHFVQQVVAAEKGRYGIVTTLDLAKQQLIERRITDYVRANRSRGIQNAAALLIDTRSMDVLAQVGSADFFNGEIQGQVDGTRAPRSPGSTLKPFVYALALEQGLIHPLSILSDALQSLATTIRKFRSGIGRPIRACDALEAAIFPRLSSHPGCVIPRFEFPAPQASSYRARKLLWIDPSAGRAEVRWRTWFAQRCACNNGSCGRFAGLHATSRLARPPDYHAGSSI